MSQLVLNKDVQIRGKMVIPSAVLREMNLDTAAGDALLKKLSEHFGCAMTVLTHYHPDGLVLQWYPTKDDLQWRPAENDSGS